MIPPNLLPEQYRQQWCVAGGWAACPALASDQDVWVYRVQAKDLDSVRATLLAHLHTWRTGRPRGPYFEPDDTMRLTAGYMHPCEVRKVAVVFQSLPAKKIHLMVTDAMAPGEIINGFDISTHAVAIDWLGGIHKSPLYTEPHERPVKLLDTETTPARMAKIAARYGHTLEAAIG